MHHCPFQIVCVVLGSDLTSVMSSGTVGTACSAILACGFHQAWKPSFRRHKTGDPGLFRAIKHLVDASVTHGKFCTL